MLLIGDTPQQPEGRAVTIPGKGYQRSSPIIFPSSKVATEKNHDGLFGGCRCVVLGGRGIGATIGRGLGRE